MMTTEGGPYHHGDLRDALVERALAILADESVDAVSLRRLARDTGVSHAAPYHHFADLDALLAAVAARGFRIMQEGMSEHAPESESDPFRRLQDAGTAYVTFAVSRPALFRLMFGGRWKSIDEYPELRQAERAAFGALENMIAVASGRGERRPPPAAARAAWALVHGLAMLLVDGRIDLPADMTPQDAAPHLTRELTSVLGRGLRSL